LGAVGNWCGCWDDDDGSRAGQVEEQQARIQMKGESPSNFFEKVFKNLLTNAALSVIMIMSKGQKGRYQT